MQLLVARSVVGVGLFVTGAALFPWFEAKDESSRDAGRKTPLADQLGGALENTPVAVPDRHSPAAVPSSTPIPADQSATDESASVRKNSLLRPGRLIFDPSRLSRVHSRFGGHVMAIGQAELTPDDSLDAPRMLKLGDAVKKGQTLAVIWSKEVGEKKTELVNALSQMYLDKQQVERLRSQGNDLSVERPLHDAERQYKADVIAAERIERTLHSWRISEEEIEEVRTLAQSPRRALPGENPQPGRAWAEVTVRAPFDGIVLEKNVVVGDVVGTELDLFKIGDVSILGLQVDVREEDLPALEAIDPKSRRWTVHLKAKPGHPGFSGSFDVISHVFDPYRHTVPVMGWIDNSEGLLRAGQFVTAEIALK